MKEPISVDKDKILSILRDRKSQKMAVVTIATASALIFSIMNYQGLTLPNNNTDKIKNAAVDIFKTGKIGDENKDTQSQPSENREEEKEKVSTASQTSTQSQPSTSNTNSNPSTRSSSSKQSQSAPAAATQTQPQTQNSQDSVAKEQQSKTQPNESSQTEKPAESKPKPRVKAEDMNKSSKPSNWDGKTEAKEGEIEKEWNEEDEVEEIKTR